jgi:hypothetical protein
MKYSSLLLLASTFFFTTALVAAEKFTVTVTHELDAARPSETIAVPWEEITKFIPDALVQHLQVTNAAGQVLPFQVTNLKPLDPKGSYGELFFQHDFAAGEKSARFTIEKIETVAPPFPTKVFARYVPERYEDFAWENDRIGHRAYGPALGTPEIAGSDFLETSAIDVWCKRVRYPIIDRWYNKGHNHYHIDQGEGMDMYQAGKSRGCGGLGIWDGAKLHVGKNYKTWKVLANGPVRAVFELSYDAWDAGGFKVSEVKRFTVDAGHNLTLVESTFTVEGAAKELVVGIGVHKNSGGKAQSAPPQVSRNEAGTFLTQWETQKNNGSLGTGIVVLPEAFKGYAEDNLNQLILAKAVPGQPLRYLIGAGWSRSGDFESRADWEAYAAAASQRLRSPVRVVVSEK